MKRLISARSLAAVALTLGTFATTSTAQARSDVYLSVGVHSPGYYVQPAPVYVPPRVVYPAPRPVYVEPVPVYRYPPMRHGRHDRHYWEHRGPYGDRDHDGIANIYDPDSRRHHGHHGRDHGPYGDLDRDGIPNQYDRDRDGDGVRNRYDRRPDNRYRY